LAICLRWASAGALIVALLIGSNADNLKLRAAPQAVTATTGAVNGIVTDPTKAVLPGVTVSLSGPSLMVGWTTLTDEEGAYRFSAVPTGDHTLTFEIAGFGTIVREAIRVGLGFTATVNAEMSPGTVTDRVTVSGSPVVDLSSTTVTTHFESEKLASLPGARDFFAVVANTPGVALSKMDVGGSLALVLSEYTAYGLRAITGMNRNEVEGIRVGGANGASDNYFSDYASFAEIAIRAVGQSASMPVPGTLGQYVSKSGGNEYHGAVYADLENEAIEATNIDADQIASGLAGGPHLDVHDVNRLQGFRDFTADVGGYLRKDRAWWYGAYRDTSVGQRYAWLLDTTATVKARVATGKVTYNLTPRNKLMGYIQRQNQESDNYNYTNSAVQAVLSSDALTNMQFLASVWKAEYNSAVTDVLYVEARVGGYLSDAGATFKSSAPRIVDVGANTVSGGAMSLALIRNRPQVNGSLSYLKTGWGGSHTFRIGGEYAVDHLIAPNDGYGHLCDCQSTVNNGVPTQVQILLGPNVSRNDLTTSAGFVDDTWRINSRLTMSLGLRLDRYQPSLPEQTGPAGQMFEAIAPVSTFNNWGPRVGVSTTLTGDGKTVLKLHYGKFWVYPGVNFTSAFNPNPSGWSQSYVWTDDANGNGRWDVGEEGRLTSVSGGSTSTRLDPDIGNTYVHQTSAYIEREVSRDFGVRTGVVLNARRQPFGTINVSRPLDAYSVPVVATDPGPDGRFGSADDGGTVTAYNLTAAALSARPVNLTTNLPDSSSEYYTWEITATKRQNARWSLLASLTHTWSREAALGTGNDFTPNALINAVGSQDRFRTWQAKFNGTMSLPWGLLAVPVLRHQSGTPFARTFVQPLNFGSAVIKAEPFVRRTPNITLFDLRTEKMFQVRRARVMGFFDVYNVLNTNAAQALTTNSGGSWLRPIAVTGPRILRVGARLDW
jgi:hypothetical protein